MVGKAAHHETLINLLSSIMRYLFAITLLSILVLVIAWQPNTQLSFWQQDISNTEHRSTETNNINKKITVSQQAPETEEHTRQRYQQTDTSFEDFIPDAAAIESMQQARLKGDPRAPKLADHHERETPTEEELGDHEQYLEYERRQQKRVYRAYVDASKIKTAQLRSMIEQGKAEGISPEEIAFAEEKIRGIEEMAAKLQQDYPDIMEDSYQPPADWLIENLGKEDNSIKTEEVEANIEQ